MKSKAKAATVAEKARMARLKEMPCLCCSLQKVPQPSPTEVHHLLSGNKRRGHLFTIPLCGWHHRGAIPDTAEGLFLFSGGGGEQTRCIGASLARNSKKFHERFGSDDFLLSLTNEALLMDKPILLEKHDVSRL